MKPTHQHADGGLYRYEGPQSAKHPDNNEWIAGIQYVGEDGKSRWTTKSRWDKRFKQLPEFEPVDQQLIDATDEEGNVIASFSFEVEQAGDVRYMLIKAAELCEKKGDHYLAAVIKSQSEMVTQGLHIRFSDFPDMIGDVNAFHAKFGQEYTGKIRMLPRDLHEFRTKFHDEETGEYSQEYENLVDAVTRQDRRDIINALELQLDALVDAAWVILGTADLQFGRQPFIEAWRRVVTANMAKVKKEVGVNQGTEDSGREEKYDIVKPAGWVAPDHRDLVQDNGIFDELFGTVEEKADG